MTRLSVLLASLLLCTLIRSYELDKFYQDKELIFISGFPQSGTSLLLQIFDLSTTVSTMIKRCRTKYGENKCTNFNNEGQWMLESTPSNVSSAALSYFNSGKYCPGVKNPDNVNEMEVYIAKQWSQYWDSNRCIFVEKSPHSMLKIDLLLSIFTKYTTQIKFLVITKHPVTLNIALPRDYDWLTHTKAGVENRDPSIPKIILSNTAREIHDNVHNFIHFLASDQLYHVNEGARCHEGWINVHEALYDMIKNQSSIYYTNKHLKIVRYEDFNIPYTLCKKIMKFTIDGTNLRSYNDICGVYFNPEEAVEIITKLRQSRSKPIVNRMQHKDVRRQLRFHQISDVFMFDYTSHKESIIGRIKGFKRAMRAAASYNETTVHALLKLNDRLQRFGYNLEPIDPNYYRKYANYFDNWDIMK